MTDTMTTDEEGIEEMEDDEVVEEAPKPQMLTAKEVAALAGSDGKTFRKFLRSLFAEQDRATPGQGGRYSFTVKEGKKLAAAFKSRPVKEVKPAVVEDDEDIVDLDEGFSDLDATDEDILEIEDEEVDELDDDEFDDNMPDILA